MSTTPKTDAFLRSRIDGRSVGELLALCREIEKAGNALATAEHCPHCEDCGVFKTDGGPEPCSWCFDNPKSVFNARKKWEELNLT